MKKRRKKKADLDNALLFAEVEWRIQKTFVELDMRLRYVSSSLENIVAEPY